MFKLCLNCKLSTLVCILCKKAFGKDAQNIKIHKGNCVYSTCHYCNNKFNVKFYSLKFKGEK